jgi:hypothetical protein
VWSNELNQYLVTQPADIYKIVNNKIIGITLKTKNLYISQSSSIGSSNIEKIKDAELSVINENWSEYFIEYSGKKIDLRNIFGVKNILSKNRYKKLKLSDIHWANGKLYIAIKDQKNTSMEIVLDDDMNITKAMYNGMNAYLYIDSDGVLSGSVENEDTGFIEIRFIEDSLRNKSGLQINNKLIIDRKDKVYWIGPENALIEKYEGNIYGVYSPVGSNEIYVITGYESNGEHEQRQFVKEITEVYRNENRHIESFGWKKINLSNQMQNQNSQIEYDYVMLKNIEKGEEFLNIETILGGETVIIKMNSEQEINQIENESNTPARKMPKYVEEMINKARQTANQK